MRGNRQAEIEGRQGKLTFQGGGEEMHLCKTKKGKKNFTEHRIEREKAWLEPASIGNIDSKPSKQ